MLARFFVNIDSLIANFNVKTRKRFHLYENKEIHLVNSSSGHPIMRTLFLVMIWRFYSRIKIKVFMPRGQRLGYFLSFFWFFALSLKIPCVPVLNEWFKALPLVDLSLLSSARLPIKSFKGGTQITISLRSHSREL